MQGIWQTAVSCACLVCKARITSHWLDCLIVLRSFIVN